MCCISELLWAVLSAAMSCTWKVLVPRAALAVTAADSPGREIIGFIVGPAIRVLKGATAAW